MQTTLLFLLIVNISIWFITMINHIVTDYQKIIKDEYVEHQPILRVIFPCIIAPILGLTYNLSVWSIPFIILLLWNINWFIADYYLNKLRGLDKNYIGTAAFMDKVLSRSLFNPLLTKFIIGTMFSLFIILIECFKR